MCNKTVTVAVLTLTLDNWLKRKTIKTSDPTLHYVMRASILLRTFNYDILPRTRLRAPFVFNFGSKIDCQPCCEEKEVIAGFLNCLQMAIKYLCAEHFIVGKIGMQIYYISLLIFHLIITFPFCVQWTANNPKPSSSLFGNKNEKHYIVVHCTLYLHPRSQIRNEWEFIWLLHCRRRNP